MKMHHIAIIGSQRDRTVEFYKALGFTVASEYVRPDKQDIMVFMTQEDTVLEIFIKEGCPARPSYPEAYGLRHIALHAADVAAMAQKLTALGYAVEPIRRDTFTGEPMTFVADPDGLPVELHG